MRTSHKSSLEQHQRRFPAYTFPNGASPSYQEKTGPRREKSLISNLGYLPQTKADEPDRWHARFGAEEFCDLPRHTSPRSLPSFCMRYGFILVLTRPTERNHYSPRHARDDAKHIQDGRHAPLFGHGVGFSLQRLHTALRPSRGQAVPRSRSPALAIRLL